MRLEQVFGQNVRRLRKARGFTQEALADEVELAVSYLGQIERGERNPTLSVVARFAEVLETTPAELVTRPPREKP
jgi:transcriptional regulator with XRE-family HTH domain